MYSRYLSEIIKNRIDSGKAIVVIGPRQVGKTTLIESILKSKELFTSRMEMTPKQELINSSKY